ncbi:PucR family transcriptional regulator [Nonomuraea dietziae]|uniref:PucR family transcriptional regulator n=1 Tax=Nonomuraea dietziae TaxID=65515 RepID=UPI0033C38BB8
MSGPRGAVGGAAEWEAPVTVAELVNGGPLAGARMYGAGESPVHQVRIVDELAVFSSVAPHTAVVLIGAAASGGWAVEMAMRRAWEQAAACVIAPVGAVGAGSSAVLSERLGITLVFVTADPLVTAVEVASAAARPAAARTQLVARCATRLAEAGASARRVLGVLNAELPGTSVAFVDEYGTRLAGRTAALSSGIVGAWPAEVVVRGPAGEVLGRLVAGGPARSAGWPSVVRTVLELAVAPLAAWAATERLAAAGDFALQSALAERLLSEAASGSEHLEDTAGSEVPGSLGGLEDSDGSDVPGDLGGRSGRRSDDRRAGEGVWARAVALGWAVRGPVSAFMVRPSGWTADRQDAPTAGEVIAATLGGAPVVRRGDGWAGWSALEPGELAERLGACLRALPWPCAAGVGTPVTGLRAVGESLLGAEAAAFLAGGGRVARSDRLGPAELLAAIPGGVLRAPATVVLRPLMAADREGTLLETLGAVLSEGGAVRAAERLGVHRNTVTARLERIKEVGYDLDDPATRLALHLAWHVIRQD